MLHVKFVQLELYLVLAVLGNIAPSPMQNFLPQVQDINFVQWLLCLVLVVCLYSFWVNGLLPYGVEF